MLEQEGNIKDSPQKDYTIIVNGRQKKWMGKTITFDQLVVLAFGMVQNSKSTIYTVTFSKGAHAKPEGILVSGDSTIVKDEMVINVTATNKS